MDPRAQRTVDALLDAAERLFGEKALADVTVEEIATGAGVAVGSIYNHFGSKAGLHAALVERALVADRAHMDRAYVEGRSPVDQILKRVFLGRECLEDRAAGDNLPAALIGQSYGETLAHPLKRTVCQRILPSTFVGL